MENRPSWSAARACWKRRRWYVRAFAVSTLLALVIAMSTPKAYVAEEMIADEPREVDLLLGLNAIQAFLRENTQTNRGINDPEIYSYVIASPAFIKELSEVWVDSYACSYLTYIKEHHRRPWWTAVIEALDEEGDDDTRALQVITSSVKYQLFRRYHKLTLQVADGDALVAAMMVDSAGVVLQRHLTELKTKKARANLANARLRSRDARGLYDEKEKAYADYVDRTFSVSMPGEETMLEALRDERDKAFDMLEEALIKEKRAEALLRHSTPAFTVYKNATVPEKPSTPHTWGTILAFAVVAYIITTWLILYKEQSAAGGTRESPQERAAEPPSGLSYRGRE